MRTELVIIDEDSKVKDIFPTAKKDYKVCHFTADRVDIVVRNNKKTHHESKFFIDTYPTWTYINLEEFVDNKYLVEFIDNYLSQEYKKGDDPSCFILFEWIFKLHNPANKFKKMRMVYFPHNPLDISNKKYVVMPD